MAIELRDWQKEAYKSFINNNYRGILKVGTGKGKTVFAIYCIQKFLEKDPDFRTCIIVPTINLMKQWKREILKFLDIEASDVSLFYGNEKDSSGKIVIFVVNSAVIDTNLKKIHLLKPFDFMIADECHHYGSPLFSKIFDIDLTNKLGLSATPERERDKEGSEKIISGIGPKIFELNHLDNPDAVPPFVIWSILITLTDKEKKIYYDNKSDISPLQDCLCFEYGIMPGDEDYIDKIKELAKKKNRVALKLVGLWSKQAGILYEAKNKLPLVKEIVAMENNSKIIVFNERIKFTNKIYEELKKDSNLNLFLIHSKLPKTEIQKRLDKFREVKKGVLIAPKLIDEGYDVPDAAVAIVVSFSKSTRQMIQRDGRILRKTNENKKAIRYSLIIEGIEEEKYFQILRKSDISSKAIEGKWLKFDSEQNTFSEATEFKENFINFCKGRHDTEFKRGIIEKLDHYESKIKKKNDKNGINEIENRAEFFERFIDVIDSLLKEYPERWPNLRPKLKKYRKNEVIYKQNIPNKEKNILKEELRWINAKIGLPDGVFDTIMRFIENEPFEINENALEYIMNLTSIDKPDIWPEKLYNFLKQIMRNNQHTIREKAGSWDGKK